MKTTLMNLVCLSLVLTFSAACGKKSDSGGSGNKYSSNPITGTATGQTAYDNIKAWQEGSAEVSTVGLHAYYQIDTNLNNIKVSMCKQTGAIAFCEEPTGCFKHTSAGINIGSVQIKTTTVIGTNWKNYKDCDITSSFQLYQKSANSSLALAVQGNPASAKYVIKGLTQQSGSMVTLYYGSFDGATSPNSYAVINTGLPSIVNPVEMGTVVNGYRQASEKLAEFQQAY